uniref:Yer049wp-like protein n=1 Tax=Pneumocystis carinii TaxID=4754 RepID=Q9HEX6_PNECA|nr:Yer049wp-like protein [Pneumocystis carinii]
MFFLILRMNKVQHRSSDFITAISQEYHSARPYKHSVLTGIICENLLRKIRHEIIENLAFSEKETDIYKVFQTGDLENLSGLNENERNKLCSLIELRNALYLMNFGYFISKVTGCGYLSGKKIDISVNMYGQGGHLLNHDDVIGSREVSFILYLIDPDETWLPSYGGALRLYPTVRPCFPESEHEKAIFPVWNQLCFFQVQPGRSFHDVGKKCMKRINGGSVFQDGFHRPQPGEEGWKESEKSEEKVLSTLQNLHSNIQDYDEPRMEPRICSITFNDEFNEFLKGHLVYLKDWINPVYLNYEKMIQLRETFLDNSVLELPDFLESTVSSRIKDWIIDIEKSSSTHLSLDTSSPWKLAKPLHKHRYLYIDTPDSSFNSPLISLLQNLFQSSFFSSMDSFLHHFNSFNFYFTYSAAFVLPPSGHWNHGQNGGYCLYMEPNTITHSTLLYSTPSWNNLHLILRDPGVLHFIKYVSLYSNFSRWDILSNMYFITS